MEIRNPKWDFLKQEDKKSEDLTICAQVKIFQQKEKMVDIVVI